MVALVCDCCGKVFKKDVGEYHRRLRLGSVKFYCNRKCAGTGVNAGKKKPIVEKKCPVCGKIFFASTKKKGAIFCSRSCASKGSVTEARREAGRRSALDHPIGTVDNIAKSLRERERRKYAEIKKYLDEFCVDYMFEYPIRHEDQQYIYDLVLFDRRIVVEFDGPNHRSDKETVCADEKKSYVARSEGFDLMIAAAHS